MSSDGGAIARIGGSSNRLFGQFPTGSASFGIAYDVATGELYATHYGTNEVSVVNASTGKGILNIRVGVGPWGVAYDGSNGFVYVVNEGSNNVSIINGTTNQVIRSLAVGQQPLFAAVGGSNGDVYISNDGSGTISVINGSTNQVSGTVNVGSGPEGLAYDLANGRLYVAEYGSKDVAVVDGTSHSVLGSVPIGHFAWDVAIDNHTKQVWVTSSDTYSDGYVSVINTTSSLLLSTRAAGWSPFSLAYDFLNDRIYISNWLARQYSDNITVIDAGTMRTVASIAIGAMPSAVAYDSADKNLWVANAGGNNVSILNGTGERLVGTVPTGIFPSGIAYDGAQGVILVANCGSNNVSVIDAKTLAPRGGIPVGVCPEGIAYDSANGDLYVANYGSDNVSVIDGASDKVVASIRVQGGPIGAVYDPKNGKVYVTNNAPIGADSYYDGIYENVTVIDGTNQKPVGLITSGCGPWGVGVNLRDGEIYVANYASGNLTVINATTNLAVRSIDLGGYAVGFPEGLAFDPVNGLLFVATGRAGSGSFANSIFVVDPGSGSVLGKVSVGANPRGIAVDPDSGVVLVTNYVSGTVSMIHPSPPPEYALSFSESGLPLGRVWSVTLNGTTNTSNTNIIRFWETNGSYSFRIPPVVGYVASPSSGSMTVAGGPVITSVMFNRQFPLSFVEGGLPPGISWSVSISGVNGTVASSTSTSSTITFMEVNGGYQFSVSSGGNYTANPASGTVSISGGQTTQSVIFAAIPPPPAMSVSVTATPSTVRLGGTVTVNTTATGGSGPLSYAFLGLPAGCPTENASSFQCSPSKIGAYLITATVTDHMGARTQANASLSVTPLLGNESGSSPTPRLGPLGELALAAVSITASATLVIGILFIVYRWRHHNLGGAPGMPMSSETSAGMDAPSSGLARAVRVTDLARDGDYRPQGEK